MSFECFEACFNAVSNLATWESHRDCLSSSLLGSLLHKPLTHLRQHCPLAAAIRQRPDTESSIVSKSALGNPETPSNEHPNLEAAFTHFTFAAWCSPRPPCSSRRSSGRNTAQCSSIISTACKSMWRRFWFNHLNQGNDVFCWEPQG